MLFSFQKKQLQFIKPAKTSRGAYLEKTSWLLEIKEKNKSYLAEVSPLVDLSTDGKQDFDGILSTLTGKDFSLTELQGLKEEYQDLPTLRFGFDALSQKLKAGNSIWVNSSFTREKSPIKINGLVWMNDLAAMELEADEKVNAGFDCIKFKVGALDFDEECKMLERFRKKHPPEKVEIRLDANGAFHPKEAKSQLKDLSHFAIHSIEQPIGKKQYEEMAQLCSDAAIDIALDEELIGFPVEQASWLLDLLKPQYIILKPTLIGGFDRCDQWIKSCESARVEWWSTSALEGNIGLFDIAQWVSQYQLRLPQGLGTGALFVKNFEAFTYVEKGNLYCI